MNPCNGAYKVGPRILRKVHSVRLCTFLFILAIIVSVILSAKVLEAAYLQEDPEIGLELLPQLALTSSINDITRYKYDILLSNKSRSSFAITSLYIKSYNSAGNMIPGLGAEYRYSDHSLANILNNDTAFIISYEGVDDGISDDDILYFYSPKLAEYGVPKKDLINWDEGHNLPPNSLALILFPLEELAGDLEIEYIEINISGQNSEGEFKILNGIMYPQPYDTPREYNLPIKGEWFVDHGSMLDDAHRRRGIADVKNGELFVGSHTRFALDFIMLDEGGNSYGGEGRSNQDYYCFGQPVYAAEDGTVIGVINDQPDNEPQQQVMVEAGGNIVLIDHGDNIISFYGHLRCGGIVVEVGDEVVRGEYIGQVGNSGSNSPHLHYHLMLDPSNYILNHPPFGPGSDNWEELPEGIPTIFTNFYLVNGEEKALIRSGTIDTGAVVKTAEISISLEGPDWILEEMPLGADAYNTDDGTRWGSPIHILKNNGNVDVDVVMTYAAWTGVDPSYHGLTDRFQTSVALESGHLITIQPPDSPYPDMVIRKNFAAGSESPLYIHYHAPIELTKPVSEMSAAFELKAYPATEF